MDLFIFLLFCPQINICGIFEITEDEITFFSKLSLDQIKIAKKHLETFNKIKFYKDWVYVINVLKYNNYIASPKNLLAYKKELNLIPEEVKRIFNLDSSIHSSIYTDDKSEIINKKPERNISKDYMYSIEERKKKELLKKVEFVENKYGQTVARIN